MYKNITLDFNKKWVNGTADRIKKVVSVHAKTRFSAKKRCFFAKQKKRIFWNSWCSSLSQKRHFFPVNAYKRQMSAIIPMSVPVMAEEG